ncbi:MAG: fold metallo-hydrolase [Blastococcus sp.]|nr:fold metallo-hydrolase [Blastococcus sp.]
MLRPELSIADAVRTARPADGVTVWLLGNAGVLLMDAAGRRIAIDPWTSPWLETRSAANPEPVARQRPARLRSEELAELVDAVLVTHEHPDHLDPGLADALTAARIPVFLPEGCLPAAEACGYPASALRPVQVGEDVDVRGFGVVVLPAAHAFAGDGYGHYKEWLDEGGAHRAVGFVVRSGGRVLFHGGDTVMWPGLAERLRAAGVDTCLLPINGRDWLREERGLVGNLTARESADLAAACGAEVLIPVHFDGVLGNTGSPGELVDYASTAYPQLSVLLPGRSGVHLPPLAG